MKSGNALKIAHVEAVRAAKSNPQRINKRKPKTKVVTGSVIDQVRLAFSVSAIGLCVGVILGASIPLTTFVISHFEWKEWLSIYTLLIIGGLGFSFKNVYQWGKAAFRDSWKAGAFVLLSDGTMVFSKIVWLQWMCLGILIGINAIASGANLVLKPEPKKPSWVI
jgi:hypothetical protein